jgi:hypothetical protein
MKIEKSDQIAALQLWVDQGWPVHRLHQKAADLWGIDADETEALLDEIRTANRSALSIERADFLAQQMTRLEALAVKAQEENNLAVALGAFKELHALAGLYQK